MPVALARTTGLLVLAGLLAVAGTAFGAATIFVLADPDAAYPIERQVRYNVAVVNPESRPAEGVRLWVHAPVLQTSSQKCLRLETSQGGELVADELGNQVLSFDLGTVPPRGKRIVSIRADLGLADRPNPAPGVASAAFLGPEPGIEADHPEIVAAAGVLRAESAGETARGISDWVGKHVRYAGYLEEDLGALYALRHGKGDCTEYAFLFTALARANGLPVRAMAGYLVNGDQVLRPTDFHNWAELYEEGRWVLVDPQEVRFGDGQSLYVATRILGGVGDDPLGGNHRFRVEPEWLSVRME
ncbi:MAG: transglutaminase-like domain-containing protein [Thermodesulfobacteriota bacterium]